MGLTFFIFWILFGSNYKLSRSRSSLRSLFNLQFGHTFLLLARDSSTKLDSSIAHSPTDLDNHFNIWQRLFIEPT